MPGQIVNISWKQLVSETALKVGDPWFKDFPKNIYSQAVFRAERAVAKEYGFMDRLLTYTNTTGADEFDIGPLNFLGEWRVTVDHPAVDENSEAETVEYKEVQYENVEDTTQSNLPDNRYHVRYEGNRYVFKYNNNATNDVINIWYVSSIAGEEDYEYYDSQGEVNLIPVVPNHYYEETLRRAIIYIAELGIATFAGLKVEKYARVLQRYTRQEDLMPERNLERDRPWIQIKAFSVSFPGD